MKNKPICRNCAAPLSHTFVDLGYTPLANSYLTRDQLDGPEVTYPLKAFVCSRCLLVQLVPQATPQQIFSDYAYFSGTSPSWVEHARRYCHDMIGRFSLGGHSQVVEVASNDGYLLQHFQDAGVPVLGVEPAANIAAWANACGIKTVCEFFGRHTAAALAVDGVRADLLCGTNVLAHVPDLHDFVGGFRLLLKPRGVVTMEFPHIMHLIDQNQFDTIYHEHYSYFSFVVVCEVFHANGLEVFAVEELPSHGGSIRVYAQLAGAARPVEPSVAALLYKERQAGLHELNGYADYDLRVQQLKLQLLRFLIDAKEANKTVVAYGAPAKGNTLLNFCGVDATLVDYAVDDSPHKQGLYLPGSHIPIYTSDRLAATRPDYVLILPWNLSEPIIARSPQVASWGGQWVVPIPKPAVVA